MAKRMVLTEKFKRESKSFSYGFIVGFLAAKGFADIQDEEAQPGVTKAKKEAIYQMGPGHAKYLDKADRLRKNAKRAA
jgi:hypothetical protein